MADNPIAHSPEEEKELPPPHDMVLSGNAKKEPASTNTQQPLVPSFWERNRYLKILLPIVFVLLLIIPAAFSLYILGNYKKPTLVKPPTPTPIPTVRQTPVSSESAATANWATLSYTFNGTKIHLLYPPGMNIQVNQKPSQIGSGAKVPTLTLKNTTQTITFSQEKYSEASLAAWVVKYGSNQATNQITVANKQAVLQSSDNKQLINAYIPLNSDTIIWASSTTNSTETYQNFLSLLGTITISR